MTEFSLSIFLCVCWQAQHVVAGHSLGGAYANATFVNLLSDKHSLVVPLLQGGVYTFGAPLILHKTDVGSSAQIIHLEFLRQQKQARYCCALARMHRMG